jgi:uncharacterized protein (DUF1330 family)
VPHAIHHGVVLKHLIIVETNLISPEWIAEYTQNVTPIVEHFGGVYLTRTSKLEILEGDRNIPHFCVVVEFPDKQSAIDFYNCEEYQSFKELRQAGARCTFTLVPLEEGDVG